MILPSLLDRAIDGVYDTKGLLLVVNDCLSNLQGVLNGKYQEDLVAGAVHSLNIAVHVLGSTIDGIEVVVKDHTFVRKDGGDVQ